MPPKDIFQPLREVLDDVNDVISGKKVAVSSDKLKDKVTWYNYVYGLTCIDNNNSKTLHTNLQKYVADHLEKNFVVQMRGIAERGDGNTLVRFTTKSFENFKMSMKFAMSVFQYLDRTLARNEVLATGQNAQRDTVEMIHLKAFHKVAFASVKEHLLPYIFNRVDARRQGELVDVPAIKSAIEIFAKVGTAGIQDSGKFIEENFNLPFVKQVSLWYRRNGLREFNDNPSTYVDWVIKRLEMEEQLVGVFLPSNSFEQVKQAMVGELLTPIHDRIVLHPTVGFRALIQEGKNDQAAKMFKLLRAVPDHVSTTLMSNEFKEVQVAYIREARGTFESSTEAAAVQDKAIVEKLLEILKAAQQFVALCTGDNDATRLLNQAIASAFSTSLAVKFARKDSKPEGEVKQVPFAEILSSYADGYIRGDFKDCDGDRLVPIVDIFHYVTDKDIFQLAHQNKLARRLISTTTNEDQEKQFLVLLQRKMGKSFTYKMEGMLHDTAMTKDTSSKFMEEIGATNLPAEFTVTVLTAGNWPPFRADTLVATPSLQTCIDTFQRYYRKLNPMKKLLWINGLAVCTASVSFPKGLREINASVYQGTILETISLRMKSGQGPLSVLSLAANLQIDAKVVKAQMASMYLAKGFQILSRVSAENPTQELPVGKSINDADCFVLNIDFTHKMRRFKLPVAIAVGGGAMSGAAPEAAEVDAARATMIDACIVRIMKSRQTAKYNEIQDVVIEQISKYFIPQPRTIRSRLEDLIARQYVRRDETDPALFHYVA